MDIQVFLLGIMVSFSPPEKLAALPAFPGWEETGEERRARYEAIEEAAHKVAFDPKETPLYRGPRGRGMTELTLLAIARHESGFARDVDLGPCYQATNARGLTRCDGGRAACLMQLEVGDGTFYGWTKDELFQDREKCFRAGLKHLRHAVTVCVGKVPHEQMFNAYARGNCMESTASHELFAEVQRWVRAGTLPRDPVLVAAR